MKPVTEQKCLNCGGALRFDPDKGKLICDFCDSEFEIDEVKVPDEKIEGFDFSKLNDKVSVVDPQSLPVYVCKSCGAEIIARAEEMSLTCPYCSNNIVLTDKLSGNLRPDGVVPFRITKDKLPQSVKEFYKDKVLLPKKFFSESVMSAITGVYVPFWIFNGKMEGTLNFDGSITRSHREGDYIVNETDHFDVERAVSIEYDDVPVDASGRIDDDLMDSLEPFNLNESKKFDMSYLAGFTADRFDVPKSNIESRVKERMFATTGDMVQQNAYKEYDHLTRTGGRLKADLDARYLLLPVYLFNIKYNNEEYKFAVNGQTGKVVGNIPTGKKESRKYFWSRAGIVAAAITAASLVLYMMGV